MELNDTPFYSVSFGAGQGSTGLVIALVLGLKVGDYDFGQIKPDRICFSDTGNELQATYRHVEFMAGWLAQHGHTLHVTRRMNGRGKNKVPSPSLSQTVLDRIEGKRRSSPAIPFFLDAPEEGGKPGKAKQHCTWDFKSHPLDMATYQHARKTKQHRSVVQILGFTSEEWMRMRTPKKWYKGWTRKYPMIEANVDRKWCQAVCLEHLGYVPVSSACAHCPHRPSIGGGSRAWIKENEPETWAKVVEFDNAIRHGAPGLKQTAYIAKERMPVEEAIVFARNKQQAEEGGLDGSSGCDDGGCWT